MTDEPKFYRALAREYMQADRIESVNWRLAIKCFATWLDERGEKSAVEVKLLRCRAAGWLAAPEGESAESTRELVQALYSRLRYLEQVHELAMLPPQPTKVDGDGTISTVLNRGCESPTVVVDGLERLLEPESKERVRVLPDGSIEKITWGIVSGAMHEDQCSWGCHYDANGRLNRNPACTVHGADHNCHGVGCVVCEP